MPLPHAQLPMLFGTWGSIPRDEVTAWAQWAVLGTQGCPPGAAFSGCEKRSSPLRADSVASVSG